VLLGISFALILSQFVIMTNINGAPATYDVSNVQLDSDIGSPLNFGTQAVFNNQSMLDSIAHFIARSQNDGLELIKSMDDAYYVGMSIYYLQHFQSVSADTLIEEISAFVNDSRNSDGGYGNWMNAQSSLESTFQAMELLSSFNHLSKLTVTEANTTLNYIQQLLTIYSGYFPIINWDVPDITSTYRAVWLKQLIETEFVSLTPIADNNATNYLEANYFEPIVGDASGYAEIFLGEPELLASFYAMLGFDLLGETEPPNAENIAQYLDELIALTGGVSGYSGSLPTVGYTSAAIQLYLHLLLKVSTIDVTNFVSESFLDDAINYLVANKIAGFGFSSSDRDDTPELSSTYFALKALWLTDKSGLLTITPDLSGVFEFVSIGLQPDFGIGDYPGDVPDLESSSQALYIANMIGNTSWINPSLQAYVEDAYSSTTGGFGFRPNTRPVVKYTYYGIQALRMLETSLENAYDIKQFLLDTQNEVGGFGETLGSLLSYLTHTYWAVESLNLLGEICLQNIDLNLISNWLSNLKQVDGTYSNYIGFNSTLASTYRAIQLSLLLNETINPSDPLKTTLLNYQVSSGGFLADLNKTVPTIESTFYGVVLAMQMNITLNITQITEFVLDHYNRDGGFGRQLGFTSNVESTYYALLLLKLLESESSTSNSRSFSEYPDDYFSPMIVIGFIPKLDTNSSFYGNYLIDVRFSDPESRIKSYKAETVWVNQAGNVTINDEITSTNVTACPIYWSLILGPYSESGSLKFRIFAEDNSNNTAYTEWFFLKTLDFELEPDPPVNQVWKYVLYSITPIIVIIGVIDGVVIYAKRKKKN